jgi:hypothetical protein
VNNNTEWINMSPDAFLERYAPAAAAKSRASYDTPRPLATPTVVLIRRRSPERY